MLSDTACHSTVIFNFHSLQCSSYIILRWQDITPQPEVYQKHCTIVFANQMDFHGHACFRWQVGYKISLPMQKLCTQSPLCKVPWQGVSLAGSVSFLFLTAGGTWWQWWQRFQGSTSRQCLGATCFKHTVPVHGVLGCAQILGTITGFTWGFQETLHRPTTGMVCSSGCWTRAEQ